MKKIKCLVIVAIPCWYKRKGKVKVKQQSLIINALATYIFIIISSIEQ